MPRLPDRVVSRMQPNSSQGVRLAASEVSSATVAEARAVASQAVDVLENREALSALATRLGGEAVPAPLSSLGDVPAGKRWLDGAVRLGQTSTAAEVKVLQRALMKIGAHHPQGRTQPVLLMLPYGADGSLGRGTLNAVDAALRLAGRTDLVPAHLPLGRDVAQAIEGLLRTTPSITMPPQQEVFPTSSSVPQRLNLLGGVALSVASTSYTARWQGVLARVANEQSRYQLGSPGLSPAATYWLQELETLRGKPEAFTLNSVNSLINGYLYASDAQDTWSTPLEFFARQGDCEDYAIAKYVSLKRLGFEESRLRLLVVVDPDTRGGHAVLAVDMPDGTYILDNQSSLVLKHQDVKQVDGTPRYTPVAALARSHQWVYGRAP